MNKTRLIYIAALLVFCWLGPADVSTAQETLPPTRLALEIKAHPGRGPSYQSVKPAGEAWYGLFGRIASWKPTPGTPPVKAVHVASFLEKDTVRVIISVLYGEKAIENKQRVTEYVIRETETITVEELKQFGVQPFEIKLIRVSPTLTPVPPVSLKGIESLAVVSSESNDSTLPSYRISLLNHSNKNVIALRFDVTAQGKLQVSGMPRGLEGTPLIETGKAYELKVTAPVRPRKTSGGYEPGTLSDQEIAIKTVIFDDGTFEGDPAVAASFKSARADENNELSRVLPLLENALTSTRSVSESLKILEHKIRLPNSTVSDAEMLDGASPENQNGPEVYYPPIRAELVRDVRQLMRDSTLNEDRFKEWLATKKKRYERWLSRL